MPRKISEERTRKEMIDPQLERADWYLRDHSKVKIEIPADGYDAEPWNGVSDYCPYRENGEVLAVVEAKKTAVGILWDKFWMGIRPDMSSRKSCVQSRVSTRGSRLTRATMRHVRSVARVEDLRGADGGVHAAGGGVV